MPRSRRSVLHAAVWSAPVVAAAAAAPLAAASPSQQIRVAFTSCSNTRRVGYTEAEGTFTITVPEGQELRVGDYFTLSASENRARNDANDHYLWGSGISGSVNTAGTGDRMNTGNSTADLPRVRRFNVTRRIGPGTYTFTYRGTAEDRGQIIPRNEDPNQTFRTRFTFAVHRSGSSTPLSSDSYLVQAQKNRRDGTDWDVGRCVA